MKTNKVKSKPNNIQFDKNKLFEKIISRSNYFTNPKINKLDINSPKKEKQNKSELTINSKTTKSNATHKKTKLDFPVMEISQLDYNLEYDMFLNNYSDYYKE